MANPTGTGTVWNLPNYAGQLFTADMVNTPLLSMIGGLTGGSMCADFEFPTASIYAHETLAQGTITETEAVAGVTAREFERTQEKNVVQIFMEAIELSYPKMSVQGRLSGINTVGLKNNVVTEKDWQIARAIESIARQVEWHFLQGTYNIATTAGTSNQTRGLIELCTVNTVAAAGVAFSKELFDSLLLEMFTNGAPFRNVVAFMNGFQKQGVSAIYGYAPEDRNVGGVNIKQIETDFGNIGIAPAHRMMPTDTILLAEVSALDVVFCPVPGKGNFFYEDLAKTGAADKGQVYGQIGIAHGPSFLHGTLTGLATS